MAHRYSTEVTAQTTNDIFLAGTSDPVKRAILINQVCVMIWRHAMTQKLKQAVEGSILQ